MAKAGRKRKLVRAEYRDGQLVRVEKGGTEIEGLSYDPSIKSYYTRVSERKQNLGRDLAAAIVKLKDELDLPAKVSSMIWSWSLRVPVVPTSKTMTVTGQHWAPICSSCPFSFFVFPSD
jgi:hypothetical protein